LIAEAEGAMDDWSVPIRRTVARALAIQTDEDTVPEAFSSIQTDWHPAKYISRAAEADAGGKQLAAVEWLKETRVGLKLLGLSEADIEEALRERRANTGRALAASVIASRAVGADDAAGV